MYRVTNTHHSPMGLYDASGKLCVLEPNESRELDLTEAEASGTIRLGGPLKVKRLKLTLHDLSVGKGKTPEPDEHEAAAAAG